MNAPDLYHEDFYLWTQVQAAALRARAGASNALDYDHLAEEVEDLGKSEHRAAKSFVIRIVEHFYKLAWSQRSEPKGGWRSEIVRFRAELEGILTRSIRTQVLADLEKIHETAARAAALQFETSEPDAAIDASQRWSLLEILGEKNDPLDRRP